MNRPRIRIDESQMTVGTDRAVRLGHHLQSHDGVDFQMNDASSLDVGIVQGGSVKVAVITLYHVTPINRMRIGLVYSMSAESARATGEALIAAAADMEAEAAAVAAALLTRAARK